MGTDKDLSLRIHFIIVLRKVCLYLVKEEVFQGFLILLFVLLPFKKQIYWID